MHCTLITKHSSCILEIINSPVTDDAGGRSCSLLHINEPSSVYECVTHNQMSEEASDNKARRICGSLRSLMAKLCEESSLFNNRLSYIRHCELARLCYGRLFY